MHAVKVLTKLRGLFKLLLLMRVWDSALQVGLLPWLGKKTLQSSPEFIILKISFLEIPSCAGLELFGQSPFLKKA